MSEKKTNDLTHGMSLVLWALSSEPMTTRQITGITKQSRASVNDLVRELVQRYGIDTAERGFHIDHLAEAVQRRVGAA